MVTRVGTNLGRYEIDAEIGHGAMGVVYRARDPKIDRTVAIKTISLSGLGPDAEQAYRERFVVEARAAGRLSHPGIVAIFDVGEDAETQEPYLVMEYLEGQSLHQLLGGHNCRLPPSTALHLAQEIAEALHYAHAQGVVHRDIKPANILVTADGYPKIADFGIAKLNQADLTLPGHVLGSPAYMAPEQLSGEGVDGRSDLFSLGVILYFMLTGHRPFQGNSTATVCFKVINHEPLPVSALESKLPSELDAIVSRAIAKDPAQRYQSGMEMASDIQWLRERLGSPQKSANLTASRLKQQAVLALPEPTHRPTPYSGKRLTIAASWPGSLTWSSVLASALLAGAIGFVAFSHMHNFGSRGNATDGNPAIQHTNWSEAAAPTVQADVKLHIEISHHFTKARASMWLDNHLFYTRALHASSKNHMLFFHKVQGHESDGVQVPAGKHQLRVRVQSPAEAYDQSKTLAVNFTPTGERTLHLDCDTKHHLLDASLQ
jgi:serine/threonine protein kinase